MRNSKILLVNNIKLDRDYKNVLSYTIEEMLTLCQNNLVKSSDNFSFIKKGINTIDTDFTYSECLQSNYIAFQNPDYSNKWFFAFIDNVEYRNDATTRITFTIDVWSTFFNDIDVKTSFVIREHVNDDTVGLHTVPEQIETGEYINQEVPPSEVNDLNYLYSYVDEETKDPLIVMAITKNPINIILPSGSPMYNGVYSGLMYLAFKNSESAENFIKVSQEQFNADNIYSIFLAPYYLCVNNDSDFTGYTDGSRTIYLAFVKYSNRYITLKDLSIIKPNVLDGSYVPHNNKLLTYPYIYMTICNNSGSSNIYKYEYFKSSGNLCNFSILGGISIGCSIQLLPYQYKDGTRLITDVNFNTIESLDASKLPTCAWLNDPYINYLTQNAINIPLKFTSDAINFASGNYVSGVMGMAQSVNQIYQHSLIPPSAQGGANQGDLNYARRLGFSIYKYSIKEEFARIIDDVFTRTGYRINKLKVPNIRGRRYWNYIQISSDDILGYANISYDYLETINNVARRGVTIWHDHDNIGNFNLDNSIIQ